MTDHFAERARETAELLFDKWGYGNDGQTVVMVTDEERLIAAIAAALREERGRAVEECAKVTDAHASRCRGVFQAGVWTAEDIAKDIRALKGKFQ